MLFPIYLFSTISNYGLDVSCSALIFHAEEIFGNDIFTQRSSIMCQNWSCWTSNHRTRRTTCIVTLQILLGFNSIKKGTSEWFWCISATIEKNPPEMPGRSFHPWIKGDHLLLTSVTVIPNYGHGVSFPVLSSNRICRTGKFVEFHLNAYNKCFISSCFFIPGSEIKEQRSSAIWWYWSC